MDSDSDQDEDEVKPPLSETVSKSGSQYNALERMSLDSRKRSTGSRNSSERVKEISNQNGTFHFENSTSDTSSIDSVRHSTNEDPVLTPLTVSRTSNIKVSYKSIIDGQVSSAEKAKNDTYDLIRDVKDNESGNREETSQGLMNEVQSRSKSESETNLENSAESPLGDLASNSAPKDTLIHNEHVDSQDDNLLLKGLFPEKSSNNPLPHCSTTISIENNELPNSRKIQNEILKISGSWSNEAEMNAESLVFQSSSVDPMENSFSKHLIGSAGLSEGVMPNDSAQDSSGTLQLAGRKRKHSGKKTADAEGAVGGSSAENSVSSGDAEESFENKDSDKDAKKKKNRCALCRKKVGLTGFECRCGGLFCAVHRYSDKHDCTFDYREMGAQEIRRNNPVVVGEKIQKI